MERANGLLARSVKVHICQKNPLVGPFLDYANRKIMAGIVGRINVNVSVDIQVGLQYHLSF